MESWINGEKSSKVKSIIDNNFDILDKRTKKMNDDISKLVNGGASESTSLRIEFIASNWSFFENLKTYIISIPYENYKKENPCIEVYVKNNDGYSSVYDGYIIRENAIDLQADMPYEGRVVIK